MAEAKKGIQATLFDYFQDTEYFTLQGAEEHVLVHQNRNVNVPSIRARIYEGIEKGLFERIGKGLYTVTRTDEQGRENTCLLVNGDGRVLSKLFNELSINNPGVTFKFSGENMDDPNNSIFVKAFQNGLYREAYQENQDVEFVLENTPWQPYGAPAREGQEAEIFSLYGRISLMCNNEHFQIASDMAYSNNQRNVALDIYESRNPDSSMPIDGKPPLTTIDLNFTQMVRGCELGFKFFPGTINKKFALS